MTYAVAFEYPLEHEEFSVIIQISLLEIYVLVIAWARVPHVGYWHCIVV